MFETWTVSYLCKHDSVQVAKRIDSITSCALPLLYLLANAMIFAWGCAYKILGCSDFPSRMDDTAYDVQRWEFASNTTQNHSPNLDDEIGHHDGEDSQLITITTNSTGDTTLQAPNANGRVKTVV